jgi:hypothetical protein
MKPQWRKHSCLGAPKNILERASSLNTSISSSESSRLLLSFKLMLTVCVRASQGATAVETGLVVWLQFKDKYVL